MVSFIFLLVFIVLACTLITYRWLVVYLYERSLVCFVHTQEIALFYVIIWSDFRGVFLVRPIESSKDIHSHIILLRFFDEQRAVAYKNLYVPGATLKATDMRSCLLMLSEQCRLRDLTLHCALVNTVILMRGGSLHALNCTLLDDSQSSQVHYLFIQY